MKRYEYNLEFIMSLLDLGVHRAFLDFSIKISLFKRASLDVE
jgi:hypothetical protein